MASAGIGRTLDRRPNKNETEISVSQLVNFQCGLLVQRTERLGKVILANDRSLMGHLGQHALLNAEVAQVLRQVQRSKVLAGLSMASFAASILSMPVGSMPKEACK